MVSGVTTISKNRPATRSPLFLRSALSRTRWSFCFLSVYLLSQAYLIPVLTFPPIWVLWPALADFALLGLAFGALIGSRCRQAISPAQDSILRSLVLIYLLCFFSYLIMLLVNGRPAGPFKAYAVIDGVYNLYRLAQAVLLFWLATQIPLDERRCRLLGRVVSVAFWLVCGSIFLTYFEIVPLGLFGFHIPRDPLVSGNWYNYVRLDAYPEVKKGLGAISYTHAYGPVQILLLLALRMHLLPDRQGLFAALYVLVAAGATLLTESRAGLAAILFFAAIYSLRNPRVLIGAVLLGLPLIQTIDWSALQTTIARHQTITNATGEDNLSGRPEIWKNHLASIKQNPWQALVGGGFGSARVNGKGSNAHMLYLQILSECGILGCALFAALAALVLVSLYQGDVHYHPMFWASVALLISATTQETFYPIPSTGHFVAFYLLALAIVLRRHFVPFRTMPPPALKKSYGDNYGPRQKNISFSASY